MAPLIIQCGGSDVEVGDQGEPAVTDTAKACKHLLECWPELYPSRGNCDIHFQLQRDNFANDGCGAEADSLYRCYAEHPANCADQDDAWPECDAETKALAECWVHT